MTAERASRPRRRRLDRAPITALTVARSEPRAPPCRGRRAGHGQRGRSASSGGARGLGPGRTRRHRCGRPSRTERVWAAQADRIHVSDDLGATWRAVGRAPARARHHRARHRCQCRGDNPGRQHQSRALSQRERRRDLDAQGGQPPDPYRGRSARPRSWRCAPLYAVYSLMPYSEVWRLAGEGGNLFARLDPMSLAGGIALWLLILLAGGLSAQAWYAGVLPQALIPRDGTLHTAMPARRLWALLAAVGLATLLGIAHQAGAKRGADGALCRVRDARCRRGTRRRSPPPPTARSGSPSTAPTRLADCARAGSNGCQPPGRNFEPLGLAVAPTAASGTRTAAPARSGAWRLPARTSPLPPRHADDAGWVAWPWRRTAQSGSPMPPATASRSFKDGAFKRHASVAADERTLRRGGERRRGRLGNPPGSGKLLRIDPDGTTASVDVAAPRSVPTDIAVGADGSVWFLQFRGQSPRPVQGRQVLRVRGRRRKRRSQWLGGRRPMGRFGSACCAPRASAACATARLTTFRLPRDNARPYSVAVDPRGNVWYADISGYIGMLPARYADLP